MKFKHNIEVQSGIADNNNLTGDSGQILSSTGSGVEWIDQNAITSASDFVFFNVKNETGSTILKGKGVMAVGTDGNSGHILIDEMVANGTVEPKYFLGVLEEDIPNGGFARVISFGQLDQFNTNGQNGETWADGQILWCDPDSPGDFTITEPDGPNVKIAAAFIVNSSTNGKIQVRVQANEGIHDLHDTKITSQVDGDVLVWDNTTGVWFNDSTLNVDYTNGRVGIGTTSPSEKLNVSGNILATGTILGSNLSGTNTGDQDLSGYALTSHNHDGVYQPAGTYNTIIGTDTDINTSGSTIIDNIYVTDGVITSMGTRTLTVGDIGAAAASHNHDDRYYTESESDSRFVNVTGDTMTGTLTIDNGAGSSDALVLKGTSPTMSFLDDDGGDDFYIHVNSNNFYVLVNRNANDLVGTGWESPHPLRLEGDTNIGYLFDHRMFADNYHPNADKWTTAKTITIGNTGKSLDGSVNVSWTLAEIGAQPAGSYLTTTGKAADSNLLDGIDSSGFVKQLSDTSSPDYTTPSSRRVNPNATNPTNEHYAITTFGNNGNVTGQLATHFVSGLPYTRGFNASWSPWRKIWTDANDGSGSGLDADTLDGQHASAFAPVSHTHTWADINGETANSVNSWGGLRHQTNDGYIDFGPANSGTAHIYTDRPSFYFNRDILVNGVVVLKGSGTTNYLSKFTGSTTLGNSLVYDNGTNVGIGTTSPNDKLDVAGFIRTTGDNGGLLIGHGSGGYGIKIGRGRIGDNIAYLDFIGSEDPTGGTYDTRFIKNAGDNGNFDIYHNGTGHFSVNAVSGSDILLLNSNVGIGTTNPSSKLHVTGEIRAYESSNTYYANMTANSSWGYFNTNAAKIYLNKEIRVDTGLIGSYNEALQLRTAGTTRMYINSSSGNVGIGTTSPSAKLDVSGSANASQGYSTNNTSRKYFWRTNNTGNSGTIWKKIGTYNSDGQSSRIMITATGTNSYSAGAKAGKMTIIAQVNNNNLLEGIYWTEGMDGQYGSVGFISTSNSNHDIYYQVGSFSEYAYEAIISDGTFTPDSTTVSTPTFTRTAAREWSVNHNLFVNSSGNVGIGTTSPASKLQVVGDGAFNSTLVVQDPAVSSYGSLSLYHDSTGSSIHSNPASSNGSTVVLRLGINNSEKMRIANNGNVGIGTTSPSQNLHVVGISGATSGFKIINSYGSPSLYAYYDSFSTSSSLYVGTPFTGLNCYAAAFNITSDYRLKENIIELTGAISKIKNLRPVRFNYKNKEETINGFIAHEVQDVVPEAVTGEKDALYEDGKEKYQGLDNGKLIPLLTAALQEAITKIEQLETRIQTLENK